MNKTVSIKFPGNEPFLCWVALDRDLPAGSSFGPVVRDCYVIECNEGGFGSVEINGRVFDVKPGDTYALLIGDTVVHRAGTKITRRGIYCMLGGKTVGDALTEIGVTSESPFLPKECFDEVKSVLYKMYELRNSNTRGSEYKKIGLVYELLGVISKNSTIANTKNSIRRAIAVFESLYHTDVSVADVAAEVGFERTYFSTVFKDYTGVTPHAYLNSLRVEKAKKLLRESDITVAECAGCVGFDPINFSRVFKKIVGMTPREYKSKHKKNCGSFL